MACTLAPMHHHAQFPSERLFLSAPLGETSHHALEQPRPSTSTGDTEPSTRTSQPSRKRKALSLVIPCTITDDSQCDSTLRASGRRAWQADQTEHVECPAKRTKEDVMTPTSAVDQSALLLLHLRLEASRA